MHGNNSILNVGIYLVHFFETYFVNLRHALSKYFIKKEMLIFSKKIVLETGSGIPELKNRVKNRVTNYGVIKPS